MIDYQAMMPALHQGCAPIMAIYRQADGTTTLPLPFPLPLPDPPKKDDQSLDAQHLRVQIAADLGFLNGVCFMSSVILSKPGNGSL